MCRPILAVVGALCQRKAKKGIVAEPQQDRSNLDVEGMEMQDAIRLNGKVYIAQPGMPLEETLSSGSSRSSGKRQSKHKR
jgi:hypothetical protein